jgi:hypothetical protein
MVRGDYGGNAAGVGARRGTTRGETKARVMVYEAVIEPPAGLFRGRHRIGQVATGLKSLLRHARGVAACFWRPDRVNLAAESPSPAGVCFHG